MRRSVCFPLVLAALAVPALAQPWSPNQIPFKPAGSITPQTLQKFLEALGVRPEFHGAKADNVADDSNAINLADIAARASFTKVFYTPGKTYFCASMVNHRAHVDGGESFLRFPTDYTGTAVLIGDGTGAAYTTAKKMRIPRVNMGKTNYNNWDAVPNSIAVRLVNVENCEISFAGASNFANGIWLDSMNNKGASYNKFALGDLIDNKIGVRIEATGNTGWSNENYWVGGRIQISSGAGTNVPGTRGIYIKTWATPNAITTTQSMSMTAGTFTVTWSGGDFTAAGFYKGGNAVMSGWANAGNNKTFRVEYVGTTTMTLANNVTGLVSEGPTAGVTIGMEGAPFGYIENKNFFSGTSIETAPLEAVIEIKGGWYNGFSGCRFEQTGSPTAMFIGMGANASVKYNQILGGYTAGGNDFIVKNGINAYSSGNLILVGERMAVSNSGPYGLTQYANFGSDTWPFLTVWPNSAGEGLLAKPTGTNWHLKLGGYYLDMKTAAAAEANPLIRLAGQTGRFYLGNGSNALGSYLQALGANAGMTMISGDIATGTAGYGLRVKEGTNAKQGVTTLVAGTSTVSNTSVTANSRIFFSRKTAGGTLGHLSYTTSAGTSFTVTSSSGTETSTLDYEIFEPGP